MFVYTKMWQDFATRSLKISEETPEVALQLFDRNMEVRDKNVVVCRQCEGFVLLFVVTIQHRACRLINCWIKLI